MESTSEQELRTLLDEGKLTEEEYQQLLQALRSHQRDSDPRNHAEKPGSDKFVFRNIPCQIWVVVGLLALEGIGNLFMIPGQPIAAIWLLAKILFIVGLLKAWKWLFILFQIEVGIHVLYFGAAGAWLVSFLNLILMILAFTAIRYFFPAKTTDSLPYANKGI